MRASRATSRRAAATDIAFGPGAGDVACLDQERDLDRALERRGNRNQAAEQRRGIAHTIVTFAPFAAEPPVHRAVELAVAISGLRALVVARRGRAFVLAILLRRVTTRPLACRGGVFPRAASRIAALVALTSGAALAMRLGGRIAVVFAGIFVLGRVDPDLALERDGVGEPVACAIVGYCAHISRASVRGRCTGWSVVRSLLTADVRSGRGLVDLA
jgi:hypothetical protein